MSSDREPRRRPSAAVALMALAAAALAHGAASAQQKAKYPEIENVRAGLMDKFKVGAWTPVRVQLRGGTERFTGMLEVVVPDDDGVPTSVRQAIDIGPGEGRTVPAYVRPGSPDPEFVVRLYDSGGRRAGREMSAGSLGKVDALLADEMIILALGKPQGVEVISKLPGFGGGRNGREGRVEVVKLETPDQRLPGRWYGYDGVDAIVLDANDAEVMSTLDSGRAAALKEWVARGGHLVVAVGSGWQRVADSAIAELLPAVPAGQVEVDNLRVLESFADSTAGINFPEGVRPRVTRFEGFDARGGKVLAPNGPAPLVVRGAYYFGRVTAVAVDVDVNPFASWVDRGLFWAKALDLRRSANDPAATTSFGGSARIRVSGVSDLSTLLRSSLEKFPGVRLVPFGWVAFFIFVYILLIGPGDYLFLKKVLKNRMELTWVTFPTIVVAVSLLAYYAAYVVKGTDLRVNKVDAVDIDQVTGRARGTSWINVFSPQNRDYDASVIPQALDRDAPPVGSADGETGPKGTETILTWFGSAEPGFGGMNGGNRLGFSGGGYAYQPDGLAERLVGVRVPIWSTKSLTARWYGPAAPVLDADLKSVGGDILTGTLTNKLALPLEDAIVAFGSKVYVLGAIEAGRSVTVETDSREDRQLSRYIQDQLKKGGTGPARNPWEQQGVDVDTSSLLRAIMFHAIEAESGGDALASGPLRYLDLSGQLALDRPMLVARIARPASTLRLDGAPSAPKINQTTMLRVILPLNKSKKSP